MASKRHIRRKVCGGKVRHTSSNAAYAAINALRRNCRVNGRMNAYRCRFCKGWHIGHANGQGGDDGAF